MLPVVLASLNALGLQGEILFNAQPLNPASAAILLMPLKQPRPLRPAIGCGARAPVDPLHTNQASALSRVTHRKWSAPLA